MPVRRGGNRNPGPAARVRRRRLARVPAGCRPRAGLRIPGARSLEPRPRAALQPGQAAARPVRAGGARRGRVRARGVRPRRRRPGHAELARLGRARAAQHRRRRRVPVGRRRAAAARLLGHGHLRGARQGAHHAPPGRASGPARHLRRARAPGGHRPPDPARRDRRGTAAGAPVRARGVPARAGADQLLGLQLDRVLRAAPRLLGRGTGRAAAAGRSPSSRPWSGRCTTRGSRSSWTWCSTTPARAARAARRCASGGWTTRRTTGWTRTTRGSTTTPRAPATR